MQIETNCVYSIVVLSTDGLWFVLGIVGLPKASARLKLYEWSREYFKNKLAEARPVTAVQGDFFLPVVASGMQ